MPMSHTIIHHKTTMYLIGATTFAMVQVVIATMSVNLENVAINMHSTPITIKPMLVHAKPHYLQGPLQG